MIEFLNEFQEKCDACSAHSKINWCSTEPPKKVSSFQKSLQTCSQVQKHNKKFYKTFKGSSRVTVERSFSYETIFKFSRQKIGFVLNPNVLVEFNAKP